MNNKIKLAAFAGAVTALGLGYAIFGGHGAAELATEPVEVPSVQPEGEQIQAAIEAVREPVPQQPALTKEELAQMDLLSPRKCLEIDSQMKQLTTVDRSFPDRFPEFAASLKDGSLAKRCEELGQPFTPLN